MVYVIPPGTRARVIALTDADVQKIKRGAPIVSPDSQTVIVYTRDPDWLATAIRQTDGTPEMLSSAVNDALDRDEKPGTENHCLVFMRD